MDGRRARGNGRAGAQWRTRLGDLAELSAVTSLAVAWPVLDSFGRSPETFVARGAAPWQIVGFAVVVFAGPPLLLLAAELAGGTLATATLGGVGSGSGSAWRPRLHTLVVVSGSGVAVARWGRDGTALPAAVLVGLAAGTAGAVALARTRAAAVRSFVRLLGVTSVGYVLLFLVASPTAGLLTDHGADAGAPADAAVRADLGERPPPVVVVVFDALPTVALLDGHGRIDRALFPHFAALAGDATWYRNNTTVSGWTLESLSVLLTGTFPASPARAALGDVHRRNLFTLLGGSYELHVQEPVTDLCPERLCAPAAGGGLPALVGDAARLWWRGVRDATGPTVPGALDDGRFDRAVRWIDGLSFRSRGGAGRPDLLFLHVVLPHDPFDYLPGGQRYQGADPAVGIEDDVWVDDADRAVAQLRHLWQVQAADTLLGRLLDRLHATRAYDDALVVVTADHGISFELDQPSRGATADQYERIMWTPLLVKAPGSTGAHVDDRDVESIDLLPLVAAELGVELPWEVDGRAPGSGGGAPVDRRRAGPGEKELVDWPSNRLDVPVDDEALLTVDGAEGFRRVLATDLVSGRGRTALWQAAPHGDLVGQPVARLDQAQDDRDEDGPAPVELVVVDGLGRFDDVDLDEPLPLELTGHVDDGGRSGLGPATLALSVNGTVAGTTRLDGVGTDGRPWRVLLWPEAFVDGENRVEAFVVSGPSGHERLRPVTLRPA